jgi:2-dehydro-3-deoxyphosphogluconate aldolase/(4S)-4-hydroxy-2-oxoglutarate aldolase
VVAILRGCPPAHLEAIAGAAIGAGLTVIEVTLDSESPLEQVARLRKKFPQANVGVGSVRRIDQVAKAVAAGASFVVTPVVASAVMAAALEEEVACIAGAATPTEIDLATRLGATAVKVFPADLLGGPAYIRAVMSPLGSPALIPTGGVSPADVAEYLRAGAVAVGLGGSLFPRSALETGDAGTVARLAEEVMESLG